MRQNHVRSYNPACILTIRYDQAFKLTNRSVIAGNHRQESTQERS